MFLYLKKLNIIKIIIQPTQKNIKAIHIQIKII